MNLRDLINFIFLLICGLHLSSQIPGFEALELYIQAEMKSNQIPGLAIGIIDRGEIQYLKGFGTSGQGNMKVTAQTPFRLASLTKSLTGRAIYQLAVEGSLDYSDGVKDLLPDFDLKNTSYTDSITIKHLLTHTSGIPSISSYKTNNPHVTLQSKVQRLAGIEGSGHFNEFQYANDNYAILGLLIERLSGMPYEQYLSQKIFIPAEMGSSYYPVLDKEFKNMAIGHHLFFGWPKHSGIQYYRPNIANGAMASSAEDMCRFILSLMEKDSTDDFESLIGQYLAIKNKGVNYVNGWFIDQREGDFFLSHGGVLADYRNFMGFYPGKGKGLVVLMNLNSAFLNKSISDIPQNIMDFVEGKNLPPASAVRFNTAYWIFLGASFLFCIQMLLTLRRLLKSNNLSRLSAKELQAKAKGTWIGNMIIPSIMMGWFWYLASRLMTSIHLSQPDILVVVLMFFAFLIFSGVIILYKIHRLNKEKNIDI